LKLFGSPNILKRKKRGGEEAGVSLLGPIKGGKRKIWGTETKGGEKGIKYRGGEPHGSLQRKGEH